MAKKKAKNLKMGDRIFLNTGPYHVRGILVSGKGVKITADSGKGTRTVAYKPDQLIETD